MKTYGRISFEAYVRCLEGPHMTEDEIDEAYQALPFEAKQSDEAGAQAVIEEFKRRNGIMSASL